MANNRGMQKTAAQIVAGLGGTNAASRFFGVKPPSVTEWVKNAAIPEDKLIRKAALLEQTLPEFSRRAQFPDKYGEIWPELGREGSPTFGALTAAGAA